MRDPVYSSVRWFVRNCIFRPFGGIRTLHEDRIPKEGAVIVAANHTSFADPPVVACSQNVRQLNFMAKSELFKPPLFGPLIRRLGAFPVHRGEADTEAIRKTLSLLAQGKAVLVFPEGTRGDGKTLGEANKGVTLLARKSDALVLPVGICGAREWLPPGAKLPRRHTITVSFGEAYRPKRDGFEADLMGRISVLVREGGCPVDAA
jgi:1-acyl-sn-glycerol-3-phosphate acyltransferase